MQHIFFATDKVMKRILKHYTESIYYQMELTAKVMKMMAAQFFVELDMGLVPDEFIVLDVIACNKNICQRDLAKLILKDRANTGRIVESLEKKGFITRVADTKNNRLIRRLSLTNEGQDIIKKVTELVVKRLEETSNIISETDIQKLKTGIITFRESLEKLIELRI